jgi:anthranilate/para-aminobenzoate synthase component II
MSDSRVDDEDSEPNRNGNGHHLDDGPPSPRESGASVGTIEEQINKLAGQVKDLGVMLVGRFGEVDETLKHHGADIEVTKALVHGIAARLRRHEADAATAEELEAVQSEAQVTRESLRSLSAHVATTRVQTNDRLKAVEQKATEAVETASTAKRSADASGEGLALVGLEATKALVGDRIQSHHDIDAEAREAVRIKEAREVAEIVEKAK